MKYRSKKLIREEFQESRTAQSDSQFLDLCGLPRETFDDALKVRNAIASLANVEPQHVRADDTFDRDLAHFDFWGSLDSVAVVIELEKCLDVSITDEMASKILDPEQYPGTTVARFVRNVLGVVRPNNG